MKVPYVANELLWWMAIQNMGETTLLAHIMELNVLQVKRGEVRCMIHTGPMPHIWWTRDPTHLDGYDHWSLEEVLQEAKEFFVGVEEGTDSLPLLCDMDQMPSDSIGQLIESCDEMIHQEEEICWLHGLDKYGTSLRTSKMIREEWIISFIITVPIKWGYTSGPLPGVNLPVISDELGCSMY
ncbi:hypothetical protein F5J12DRAFT_780419 [Pisolithus orientalis]|uniref:uncharacterized protein n=1 Tax=Pisolithus orientalis TaxID=936130 RepID=UPI002224A2CA|nr:uncharacterized protein F5J12DRAFT_780419 [Pisolithus orientalis]KAI6028908.1 hypothetical protein F5J12DRAFT_780419 [Pisolithus orientalis]